VTVAKEIELKDAHENMGAQMVKEVASRNARAAVSDGVDASGDLHSHASEHPGDPQQESYAQHKRDSDRQNHEWDAEHDAHRRKEVADDVNAATE
jgi:hypothetical protein